MNDAILTCTVSLKIGEEFLTRMMEGKPVARVHVKRWDNAIKLSRHAGRDSR